MAKIRLITAEIEGDESTVAAALRAATDLIRGKQETPAVTTAVHHQPRAIEAPKHNGRVKRQPVAPQPATGSNGKPRPSQDLVVRVLANGPKTMQEMHGAAQKLGYERDMQAFSAAVYAVRNNGLIHRTEQGLGSDGKWELCPKRS